MKKCILFLINGLGIEKAGSYSIAIDQVMPKLSRVKETAFFTSAITSSLEYKSAYQRFFLGDTYRLELDFISKQIINENITSNPTYQQLSESIKKPNSKLHIFVEPTNDKVVEQINNLIKTLTLEDNKKVYVHLILNQQTASEYDKIISIINYIKFHLDSHITVGFVTGSEYLPETLEKENLDYVKKLFFMCSAERWTETEKKLEILKSDNVRPCFVQGFCATNECYISNGDTILFFNTRRNNYDNLINGLLQMAPEVFKVQPDLTMYSILKLNTQFNIPCFTENTDYENSLSHALQKHNKKAVILTDNQNINLVNFYANGMNSVNNPSIGFLLKDDNLYNKDYLQQLIETTPYDLIIFDYHMDTSRDINHLKTQLSQMDVIIGHLAELSENKHTLIITSLYGLKKEIPIAEYNAEKVLIDYETQIPIFFYDYSYPKGKYRLMPGETNDILSTALNCITNDPSYYSLIMEKGLLNNLMKAFK